MSLFNTLSNEVKLFIYEQELATVNATIDTLIGYGFKSEVTSDHGLSLLKKRKEDLEDEIARIKAFYESILSINRRSVNRVMNVVEPYYNDGVDDE